LDFGIKGGLKLSQMELKINGATERNIKVHVYENSTIQ
jgi:hypothetical protein